MVLRLHKGVLDFDKYTYRWLRCQNRKELNATLPFENKAPEAEYIVLVAFTVDKEGIISNIQPMTKQGFGMEEEAVRVIQQSGKWLPATLYGKTIKSHGLQPVQFVVTKPI